MAVALTAVLAIAWAVWPAQSARIWRVGYFRFTPFMMVNADGSPRGLAIDLFEAAAKRKGILFRWVLLPDGPDRAFDDHLIDIYPMAADLAPRKERYHVSLPWWEANMGLVSRQSSGIRTKADVLGRTLGYIDWKFGKWIVLPHFEGASLVPMKLHEDIVRAVCTGATETGVLEFRTYYDFLMSGPPECTGVPLQITLVPEANLTYSVIGTRAAAPIVDAIQSEIARMALDGSMSRMAMHWQI